MLRQRTLDGRARELTPKPLLDEATRFADGKSIGMLS
jgi:hypothetical protein